MTQVFQIEPSESATLSTSKLLDACNSDNALTDIAAEIAGLHQSKALAVAGLLSDRGEEVGFCLGGVLGVINDMGWWQDTHESFDEFVFETCNFHVRQAQHLMRTYRYLMDGGIEWSTVKPLGWTKLRLLVNAGKLTAENAADWVAKAAGKAMTVRTLDNELKFVPALPKPQTAPLSLVQPSSFNTSTPVSEPTDGDADADADEETENESADADSHVADADEDSHLLLKQLMQSAGADTVRALFEELFPGVPLAQAGE